MRRIIMLAALAVCLTGNCSGQAAQKTEVPKECTAVKLVHDSYAKGPFKFRPGEIYKQVPVITFEVSEDGIVSNVKLVRSSGVKDIDKNEVQAISQWRYKPRPTGCGVIESEVAITIDFY
jgi:TonB family protein